MANTKITSRVIADNSVGIDALNVTDGTNGQYLQTDGSGTLSFSTVSGYTDSDVETYLDGGTSTPTFSTAIVTGDFTVDTNTLYVDSTNNRVGIGIGDSAYLGGTLHIQTSQPVIRLQDSDSSTGYTTIEAFADGTLELATNHGDSTGDIKLTVNANNALFVESPSGNVGIGTDSPDHKFHVDVGAPNSSDKTLAAFSSQRTLRDIGFVWDDSTSTLGVATLTDHALTFHTNGNSAERMRLTSDGVAMGDTDGDYNHRGATGGLHVKRGGILMNGPPGDANMSSGTNGNQWTYLGQGGRGGSFTSLTISVPNPNNGASGVGYGGFSLEFYIAGYNAKYHSGHFSGYVNASITLSKRAFWDSSGSGTLSSGSVGAQGFYLTIGFPSMTHPTCKFVINKGGHGGSTGNAAWTDMDGVSITWA